MLELVSQAPGLGLLALMWWDLRKQVRNHDRRLVRLETKAGIEPQESV